MEWIVYDPLDCETTTFATQAKALDHANHLTETYLDNGYWAEEVLEIYVAIVTHVVERTVVAARAVMGDEAFEELTGDTDGNDEWWEHHVVALDAIPNRQARSAE